MTNNDDPLSLADLGDLFGEGEGRRRRRLRHPDDLTDDDVARILADTHPAGCRRRSAAPGRRSA